MGAASASNIRKVFWTYRNTWSGRITYNITIGKNGSNGILQFLLFSAEERNKYHF